MLRTGSILLNFVYNYIRDSNNNNNTQNLGDGQKEIDEKNKKIRILTKTLLSYGGLFAKIAQLTAIGEENDTSFSDCKPYNQKETIEYIMKLYNSDKELFKNVKTLNEEVLKAGSIGQIHTGTYNDDRQIAIKVQYFKLVEQFNEDLILLDKLTKYLFNFIDLKDAVDEIKEKLLEELDYENECKNHQILYDLWKTNENIKIPELIPELCTKNMIGMEFIDGDVLNIFLEKSTLEEKNIIGNLIIDFIFTNFFRHRLYYSDIHYGNFIIKNNNILYITDFGCVHNLSEELLNILIELYKTMLTDNKEEFYNVLYKMNILHDKVSEESKKYAYEYFKIQFTPWISEEFEFSEEWLKKALFKETLYMREWKLPKDYVFLNKIAYNLYYLCTKLKMKGNFSLLFHSFIS
jgi:predicted unusual protein kinase regulating ubiquinone biosynthesis (AarF/ABC1/UbiB family)